MALVNTTKAGGNNFGVVERSKPWGAVAPVVRTTVPASIKIADVVYCRHADRAFNVDAWGIKAVKADIVVDHSDVTVVFKIYHESAGGTQTLKGSISLTPPTTIEHEDPPAYDNTFTGFHVAAGEYYWVELTTAAGSGGSSGDYSVHIVETDDPSSQTALG